MELLTILFLILFFAAIPIVLFKIIWQQYGKDLSVSKALLKFIFSFLGYTGLSIFTFLFLLLVYIGPHPYPEQVTPFENKIVGLLAVFVYGVVGWLLCSYVNGEFVKPWRIFRFKNEEPQSILDTE
jgi:hypothetical protein